MLSAFFESFLPTVHADEQPSGAGDSTDALSGSDVHGAKEDKEKELQDKAEPATASSGSDDDAEEEEEEEEEVEDQAEAIREACGQTKVCANFKHHFEECGERLAAGKTIVEGETCVEELFHYMHCVDDCAAPKIFAALK
ncbi:hypothetical protein JCM10212_004070 [Sporobolomyces blumeae]